jgi:hypothetical protein
LSPAPGDTPCVAVVMQLKMRRYVDSKTVSTLWKPSEHPRDRVGRFTDDGDGPAVPPLTDAQYDAHTARLEERLNKAFKYGKATNRSQTLKGDGYTYHPDRAKQHKQIVDDLMAKYDGVPNEGKAILSGGLGGAGKSTVLAQHAGVNQSQYATLNADDIKEMMAERGMIPRTEGVSPLESASLVHEESRHITLMLARQLQAMRKNVIWDITMNDEGYVSGLMKGLRKSGYGELRAVFVDIPVETSVRRALTRHRTGLEAYRNGQGYGGRFVPPHIIRKSESYNYPGSSHNRTVFERTKKYFDSWQLWDNSVDGEEPELLDSKGGPA